MPFQSEAQRRFLWLKHPQIARKWANEEKGGHMPVVDGKHYAYTKKGKRAARRAAKSRYEDKAVAMARMMRGG